jgi:hypothetical protein
LVCQNERRIQTVRACENVVHRRMFGPKKVEATRRWRKMHNGKLHNLKLALERILFVVDFKTLLISQST